MAPISDPEERRRYHKLWMRARRTAYFSGKTCCKCGASDRLELDHISRETKVAHRIWSWSQERRDSELSKCQILCKSCHVAKSRIENIYRRKLDNDQVDSMRRLFLSGTTVTRLSEIFTVSRRTVKRILDGSAYRM